MHTSESIKSIAPAMLKAQRKIESAVKDAANPFFKSKYANLNSVMEACKGHLNDQGISIMQPVVSDELGDYVETRLQHESGEFFSSRMKLHVSKADMQAYGSAVSYARRYSLQSFAFIGAEDDDAEKATDRSYLLANKTTSVSGFVSATISPTVASTSSDVPKKPSGFRRLTPAPPAVEVVPVPSTAPAPVAATELEF